MIISSLQQFALTTEIIYLNPLKSVSNTDKMFKDIYSIVILRGYMNEADNDPITYMIIILMVAYTTIIIVYLI